MNNSADPINAISVDVEEYFHVSAFANVIDRNDWGSLQRRSQGRVAELLDLFDEFDVKATFFVLGWLAEREPQMVRRIASRGHEIACHGYSHRLIYEQTPDDFRAETTKAKSILEDLIDDPVLGYRAATYSITEKSLWALDILWDAGFTYDSSIFPILHDRYGIPTAPTEPHRLETPNGKSIIEFPLSTLSLTRLKLPVAGGGYFRLYPYVFSRWALKRINQGGQPFIFYLHPWELDPNQPHVNASSMNTFRHYNNLRKFQPRLRRLLSDFQFDRTDNALKRLDLL